MRGRDVELAIFEHEHESLSAGWAGPRKLRLCEAEHGRFFGGVGVRIERSPDAGSSRLVAPLLRLNSRLQ